MTADAQAAFASYKDEALAAIDSASSEDALELVRVEFLGKKRGRLKDLQSLLGQADPEQRPLLGKSFNQVQSEVKGALEERQGVLARPVAAVAAIDVTLPGPQPVIGRRHPITRTIEDFKDIIGRMGFRVATGPELEDDHHNFVALNIPPEHPARDPLENFYLATALVGSGEDDAAVLMRSQTSTVQIRVMEQTAPPVRIVSLGRCYRPDTIDATHHCMFHQMEGLMVDTDVTMADLKTVLKHFATAFLGDDVSVRFRPSFFPFTEPSVEVDVLWRDRWLELGGAGMVDPNVLRHVGFDPEEVTGFAFGLGIERFCMMRYQVTDIRRFFENDVRFLSQF
ncbi:MAG TPA: phenylalanine--tRNA ligase subunit alpha [Planctomycetaceae bacterium]|nr:phenylalanine--tRNA ligase subunit alpha [Planctomycetaceae bacterium]HCC99711.1 phenylalanine--tRNA ligase subunit alpha [Planctomycetaceae bacterium]|tara:strand:- start:478 stop:1494 length:1017 start_codon:yes stop_codon:yes gene_type:complete